MVALTDTMRARLGQAAATHAEQIVLPVDYGSLTAARRAVVRAEYVRRQQGLCHHCKAPLAGDAAPAVLAVVVNWRLFPDGFTAHSVHLHHDHRTGLTIGAVHARCNAVLWVVHGE